MPRDGSWPRHLLSWGCAPVVPGHPARTLDNSVLKAPGLRETLVILPNVTMQCTNAIIMQFAEKNMRVGGTHLANVKLLLGIQNLGRAAGWSGEKGCCPPVNGRQGLRLLDFRLTMLPTTPLSQVVSDL